MRHEPTTGVEDPNFHYRITWRSVDTGQDHEEVFTSRDQGWDFYQDMQRTPGALSVSWEHIPA